MKVKEFVLGLVATVCFVFAVSCSGVAQTSPSWAQGTWTSTNTMGANNDRVTFTIDEKKIKTNLITDNEDGVTFGVEFTEGTGENEVISKVEVVKRDTSGDPVAFEVVHSQKVDGKFEAQNYYKLTRTGSNENEYKYEFYMRASDGEYADTGVEVTKSEDEE